MKQSLYFLLCATTLYACTSSDNPKISTTSFDVSKVRQSIEATNKKFADATLKGDSATVVGLYHSEAKIFPPNMPSDDRKMMGAMSTGMPKMGIKSFTINTTDVSGNDDQVVETGTYVMGDGKKTVDEGKYIVVWKQENGEWKLWRDIWNSNRPSSPPSK